MIKPESRHQFGSKLRAVRERRGITLKRVAGKAGVSESLVSQIERNKVSPSVDTLLSIADVLGIDYEYLFSDYRKNGKVEIIRAEERSVTRDGLVTTSRLSLREELPGEYTVEVFMLEVAPGGQTGDLEYGHAGREFGIVLDGVAELLYGDDSYDISKGDTVSFASRIPHILKNRGHSTLKAVWIVSPPRQASHT
ncbi:helix-turn-helix domain-containing protein [Desulfoluna sp.]|uniref:helix-turn-helix domain-containing protein n=1 Tax=Desulfoluna sp. TaxID=2045199 RepID=UPI002620EDBA|nr:helix-turn-helix domain-containing protein [Desulfoluna sp.]